MKLTFVGGAGSVTGASYLLEHEGSKILIDCGLFQGTADNETHNLEEFPFDPHTITALFVTHTHTDHIGRIPLLVKKGFSGPIYSTGPTRDAAHELLLDALHLMEHQGQEPLLYTVGDIDQAFSQWKVFPYHTHIAQGPFEVVSYNAGHVLGSASYLVTAGGVRVAFSGDLGNIPAPLVKDTEYIPAADYALVESCYGNRTHESVDERKSILEDVIEDTVQAGGTLMIPAFAMERTQELLYELNELVVHGRIPSVPIFIDSPLAIKLTSIYEKYLHDPELFDEETQELVRRGEQIFNFPGLRYTLTTEESKQINSVVPPKIIIAGSGMSQGGRILHHELRYLPDPNSTILFVGFQPEGSLGRSILDGAGQVTVMGDHVPVRCRVRAIGGYSAHADQPLLMKWVDSMKGSLKKVFVVQGEEDQSAPLAAKIKDELAVDAVVPTHLQSVELN